MARWWRARCCAAGRRLWRGSRRMKGRSTGWFPCAWRRRGGRGGRGPGWRSAGGRRGRGGRARAWLQRLKPQYKHANVDHAEVVGRALLVARGDAAELLQAVDQALNEIAATVCITVEVGLPALVALARDHRPDVSPAQAATCGRAAVALVASRASWPQTGSAP